MSFRALLGPLYEHPAPVTVVTEDSMRVYPRSDVVGRPTALEWVDQLKREWNADQGWDWEDLTSMCRFPWHRCLQSPPKLRDVLGKDVSRAIAVHDAETDTFAFVFRTEQPAPSWWTVRPGHRTAEVVDHLLPTLASQDRWNPLNV